jgi:hypothetical protein
MLLLLTLWLMLADGSESPLSPLLMADASQDPLFRTLDPIRVSSPGL